MKTVKETTFKQPLYNHKYLLTDDGVHCLGYIPQGETETIMFRIPMKFNGKGRSFTK